MKVTVGGTMSMTLMNEPYSPVKVESTFSIEKDVNESVDPQDVQESYSEKINELLKKDLDNKMRVVSKKQKELKNVLKA